MPEQLTWGPRDGLRLTFDCPPGAPLALSAVAAPGVRLEAIEALRYGREEELTEDEALLASFIRKVMSGTMDPDTWGRMEGRIGERGAVDYASFILFLFTTMRNIQIITAGKEPSDEEVDQLIADIKSGKREVDDYRKRIS